MFKVSETLCKLNIPTPGTFEANCATVDKAKFVSNASQSGIIISTLALASRGRHELPVSRVPFVRDSNAEKQSDVTSDYVSNGCKRKELEYLAFFCMLAYQLERDRPRKVLIYFKAMFFFDSSLDPNRISDRKASCGDNVSWV